MNYFDSISLDSTLDVVAVLDAHGRIRYVTPCVDRILGYAPAALVGRRALELVHPDDREAALASARTLRTEDAAPRVLRVLHAERRWHLLEVLTANLDADPTVGGLLLSCRDLTRSRELDTQLLQAQQMRAVATLTGRVAHEFNNLFTVVQGHVWRLSEMLPETGAAAEELGAVRDGVGRAAVLTKQLLAYSRQQVLEPRLVDAAELVTSLRDTLREQTSPTIELEFVGGDSPLPVRVDPDQLDQVLRGLVANACDAMPRGGTVTVRTEPARLDEHSAAGFPYVVRPGEYVRLAVHDTGEGMTPEVHARAFEPFFTTHAHRGHAGLGLSSAYGVVKQSGGYIWIDSAPGEGTSVAVYLPTVEAEVRTPPVDVHPMLERRGPATVLVVEDNHAVRAMVLKVLLRRGYGVLEAADGEEALRICETYSSPIDLVVTDVMMPGIDGREMIEQLRQTRGPLAVLFMSGYAREASMQPDVFDEDEQFIQKPFTPDAFIERVEAALRTGGPVPG